MDLVKSVIQEVNIHDEDPESFRSYFNVNGSDERKEYDIYYLNEQGGKVLHTPKATINIKGIKPGIEGYDFRIDSGKPTEGHNTGYQGEVTQVIAENQFVINELVQERIQNADPKMPDDVKEYYVNRVYILEPIAKNHSAFNAYAF
jgi:hypothetical protein